MNNDFVIKLAGIYYKLSLGGILAFPPKIVDDVIKFINSSYNKLSINELNAKGRVDFNSVMPANFDGLPSNYPIDELNSIDKFYNLKIIFSTKTVSPAAGSYNASDNTITIYLILDDAGEFTSDIDYYEDTVQHEVRHLLQAYLKKAVPEKKSYNIDDRVKLLNEEFNNLPEFNENDSDKEKKIKLLSYKKYRARLFQIMGEIKRRSSEKLSAKLIKELDLISNYIRYCNELDKDEEESESETVEERKIRMQKYRRNKAHAQQLGDEIHYKLFGGAPKEYFKGKNILLDRVSPTKYNEVYYSNPIEFFPHLANQVYLFNQKYSEPRKTHVTNYINESEFFTALRLKNNKMWQRAVKEFWKMVNDQINVAYTDEQENRREEKYSDKLLLDFAKNRMGIKIPYESLPDDIKSAILNVHDDSEYSTNQPNCIITFRYINNDFLIYFYVDGDCTDIASLSSLMK